jgi:hypothetical protein
MGGGIIILAKKGPLFVRRLSVFVGVHDSRRNKKRGKRGAPEKKDGGNEWTGLPNVRLPGLLPRAEGIPALIA